MKLTDKDAIKALEKVRIYELSEMVSDYPENEREGRSDWDMIANEAGWLLDSYDSNDTCRHEDLMEARGILRETNNGKFIPLRDNLKPKYREYDIQNARDRINEYNRLVRFVARLKKMGLYCPYC